MQPSHFTTAVAGIVLGVLLAAVVAAIRHAVSNRRRESVADLLRKHFGNITEDQFEVQSREYPYRVMVDGYGALIEWIERHCQTLNAVGVPINDNFMSSEGIATLLAPTHEPKYPTAIEFDSFDVGNEEPEKCAKHALWLLNSPKGALAVLWTSRTTHGRCGFETKLRLELAHRKDAEADTPRELFRQVESAIQEAVSYRGKILSLENGEDYTGQSNGLMIHSVRHVNRDEVILPDITIRLLERNIVRFIQQRPELAKLGFPTKKGVLFYGPPGTGKTHTIHYLVGALKGHTTLLVTAEQVGMLDEYMAVARLLQPSIVVLEDIDLIGRDREHQSAGCESLLNRLLNEMDGLKADAEILFLLTTNRPESLERALAARPGRIDQAIEFPLPDEIGRRKLVRLYAAGANIADEVVASTARATQGVSASFIKELMRRAIQFHLECRRSDGQICILQNDVDQAIDELLFAGGSLNRTLLGAESATTGEE